MKKLFETAFSKLGWTDKDLGTEDLLDGSIGAGGLRESGGMLLYVGSEVGMRPLEPLTMVLWLATFSLGLHRS